jgi:hypothetical protein
MALISILIMRSDEDPDEAAVLRLREDEHDALANILDYAEKVFGSDLDGRGQYVLGALANTLKAARRPGGGAS